MKKLTKTQIETIRLVADFLVIGDITDNVFAKMFTPQQLEDFKAHMKKTSPIAFLAGQELNKQIKEVREVWKQHLLERKPT